MDTSLKNLLAWFFLVGNMSLLALFRITNLYFENFSFFTFLIASILYLFWLWNEQKAPLNILILLCFVYFITIFLSLIFSLYHTPSTLNIFMTKTTFFLFFSIIPFMSGTLYKQDIELSNKLVLISATIFLIAFAIEINEQYSEIYRAFSLAGNPISQSLSLSALFLILLNKLRDKNILYLMTLTISFVWIFSIGSRGVGISYTLVIVITNSLMYWKAFLNSKKIYKLIISVLYISFLAFLLIKVDLLSIEFINNGWLRWEGFLRNLVHYDLKLENLDKARYEYKINAIEVFLNNWLLGDAMYDSLSGAYAHSLIFDTLARSGLIGSSVLFICIIIVSIYAVKNIINSKYIAISGIFLMTVFLGLISASIFINPVFWFSFGFIIKNNR